MAACVLDAGQVRSKVEVEAKEDITVDIVLAVSLAVFVGV
eukprot:COSAG05_NODE_17262_length_328_cov_1.340611_1_plen_39_part_01